MKKKVEKKSDSDKIDSLFIEAVDIIKDKAQEIGLRSKKSDSGIGAVIYPSSTGIVNEVRHGKKHIPHSALIRFAKNFNVDMNYFYHDNIPFKFDFKNFASEIQNYFEEENLKEENLLNFEIGENKIDDLKSFETNKLAKKFQLDTMVKLFANTLTGQFKQTFYNILHIIQFDYLECIEKLQEKNKQLTEINDIKNQLINSKESEIKILKQYVN